MGAQMSVKHAVPQDDRCRDRSGELMAGDDDQRQVERVTSRVAVEVKNEIPCPETGEEVDVGEPTVVQDQRSDPQSAPQSVSQPVPTVRVGGSSGSGTRSGVGSRGSETNTGDRETKRVRFTESRGQKRQGEDVVMQMLRCLHTRHGELKTLSGMQQMQRPNK